MNADMAPLGLLGSFLARFARLALTGALAALLELLDDCSVISKPRGGTGSPEQTNRNQKKKDKNSERTGAARARGHEG